MMVVIFTISDKKNGKVYNLIVSEYVILNDNRKLFAIHLYDGIPLTKNSNTENGYAYQGTFVVKAINIDNAITRLSNNDYDDYLYDGGSQIPSIKF